MTKPITPDEVPDAKATTGRIPKVIEAANELIAKHWDGSLAEFELRALSNLSREKLGMAPNEPFERGDLDIEPVFRAAGWSVEFDRPGYNESYPAVFRFRRK